MDDGQLPGGQPGQAPNQPSIHRETSEEGSYTDFSSSNTSYDHYQRGATPQYHSSGQAYNAAAPQSSNFSAGRGQPGEAFDLSNMSGALPDTHGFPRPPQGQQQVPPGPSMSAHGSQPQNPPQFAGQMQMNTPSYNYPSHYVTPYQHTAAPPSQFTQMQPGQHAQHVGMGPGQGTYSNTFLPNQQQQQYMYYQGQYAQQSYPNYGVQGHPAPQPGSYNQPGSAMYGQGQYPQPTRDPSMSGGKVSPYGSAMAAESGFGSGPFPRPGAAPGRRGSFGSRSGPIPSSPRGPPRKPKQSGHALWVGNLPSGANVSDLKDHFSRDATKTIESVFLISKSNCAFVNYRTDAACAAAMARFHESRFQGVRLVCRLRRSSSTSAPGVPTGPAALTPTFDMSRTPAEASAQDRDTSSKANEPSANEPAHPGGSVIKVLDKYFILKSLTVEDMELSVRNSIWATQAHNEDALNKAYEGSENVYLIFSANKSGEYFGYARMASPISEESAATLEWAPRAEAVVDDPDVPRSIPTQATIYAPKGRIIDDSARGTIFWEADPLEDPEEAALGDGADSDDEDENRKAAGHESADEGEDASGPQAFGKPFKIEWLSTSRLPFYRTRGLRNPWNANREVKIARDGTELETSVGRRLVQMFQKAIPGPLPPSGAQPSLPIGWQVGKPY